MPSKPMKAARAVLKKKAAAAALKNKAKKDDAASKEKDVEWKSAMKKSMKAEAKS